MDANIISAGTEKVINLVNNPKILILGIVFIGLTVLIMYLLKHFIINSVIGIIGLFVLTGLGIKLPFVITLLVTAVFGLAGLGTMLILEFLGAI